MMPIGPRQQVRMAKDTHAERRAREDHEFFSKHLPYEITMLRGSHRLLRRLDDLGARDDAERTDLANALIESFCVHARNLIDFLKGKNQDFKPHQFTVATYAPPAGTIARNAITQINEQISHLTRGRTTSAEEKINAPRRLEILMALEDAIDAFNAGLTDEYKKLWDAPPREVVIVADKAGASSQFLDSATTTASGGRDPLKVYAVRPRYWQRGGEEPDK